MSSTVTKFYRHSFTKKPSRVVGLIGAFLVVLLSSSTFAQHDHHDIKTKQHAEPGATKTGILLLAHGGGRGWNAEVSKLAAVVNQTAPAEVAFGMASKRTMQEAIDRLVARGVQEIIAVPLFISSHSSVITSTEYLLGRISVAPPDLAIFAGMDHSHSGSGDRSTMAGAESMRMETSFDPKTPVKSPVPVRMTAALDRHPLVADILLSRAQSISREPAREVVILVAHGPVPDDDNAMWLADMGALAERMRAASQYKRIEYLTCCGRRHVELIWMISNENRSYDFPFVSHVQEEDSRFAQENEQHIFKRNHPLASQMLAATAYLTVRDDADEPLRSQAAAELRNAVERATTEGSRVLIVPLVLSYGGIEEGIRKRLEGLSYTMSTQGLLPDERLARLALLVARGASKS